MKTDKITVSSQGARMGAALEQAEKVAAYKGLKMKDALHLRLLTEEMMGLMRSITGEREGIFWIEDEDGEYRLHLQVRTLLNSEEREQLLAVSSSGKNESAKGIMGRIRDFFDWGSDEDLATYTWTGSGPCPGMRMPCPPGWNWMPRMSGKPGMNWKNPWYLMWRMISRCLSAAEPWK